MLTRSTEEIKRLNGQHPTMRAVLGDNLIHPSITPFSSKEYRSFADVATGTGIWLQDLRNRLRESSTYAGDGSSATTKEVEAGETKRKTEFVGFDISSAQFPPEGDKEAREGIEYVVHDMTKPFTAEYRERFDFVHVRFVGFALKAEDLSRGVENVCSLIRKSFVSVSSWEVEGRGAGKWTEMLNGTTYKVPAATCNGKIQTQ